MIESLIIIGAGGHAGVLIESLRACKKNIVAIVDPVLSQSEFKGIKVIKESSVLLKDFPNTQLVNGIGSLPGNERRVATFQKFKALGFSFAKVIHPTSILSSASILAEGVQVMAGAIIQSGCNIGENVIINTGSIVDHDCIIKQNCHIATGAVLCGAVTLGNSVHVGAGACVIQCIDVGDSSVIGAGVVVTKNIPSKSIIYPARPFVKSL